MSADLRFTTDGFFFLLYFRQVLSALGEWNSTKTGHMLGSECNLKMHVRNPGYPIPLQIGVQNHLFSMTAQLNGNFNAPCLQNETRYKPSRKSVIRWQLEGSPISPRNDMNFGPQTASNWISILLTICKFCVLLHLSLIHISEPTRPY